MDNYLRAVGEPVDSVDNSVDKAVDKSVDNFFSLRRENNHK